MANTITSYFTDPSVLDQLSVTEIEHLLAQSPSSSIYKLLLAKKMGVTQDHELMITNNDRVMVHYLLEENGKIPTIHNQNEDQMIGSELIPSEKNQVRNDNDEVLSVMDLDPLHETIIISSETKDDTQSTSTETILQSEVEAGSQESVKIKGVQESTLSKDIKTIKGKKKKKNKFKLNEYSGISDFSKWLLSFKKDDVDKQIRKEEKAAKKRALEQTAKKSVTKSPAIISEPLADLLANQGHLDDAKKMFEQLMQKYPEKSSYFAAKINLLIKS